MQKSIWNGVISFGQIARVLTQRNSIDPHPVIVIDLPQNEPAGLLVNAGWQCDGCLQPQMAINIG